MPSSTCFVPHCKSGYASTRKLGIKVSLFGVPKDNIQFEKWKKAIPRDGLKKTSKVCGLHFYSSDILTVYEHVIDGKIVSLARDRPSLCPDAIPRIFPKCPSYITVPEPRKRSCKIRLANAPLAKKAKSSQDASETCSEFDNEIDAVICDVQHVIDNLSSIAVPSQEWVPFISITNDAVMFCHLSNSAENELPNVDKQLYINEKLNVQLTFEGKTISSMTFSQIRSCFDVETILADADKLSLCSGYHSQAPVLFSKCCLGTVANEQMTCTSCKKEKKRLSRLKSKGDIAKQKLHIKKRRQARNMYKVKSKLSNVMHSITDMKAKMAKHENIEELISQLPATQRMAVESIFKAAKTKGSTGNRYSHEWMLECIFMKIKSTKFYNHMRTKNIIVLPCEATIRKYLRSLDCGFGFKSSLFLALKNKTKSMPESERHGILLLDEMKLSQGVKFNRDTLLFEGFVNLGDGDSNTKVADHALVVMFQPFRGSWVQAVGCFLTHNNADRDQLSRIILECIASLENAGIFVDGVTTDGAQWNRSMWTKFGVCTNNSFRPSITHPMNDERKLFFLSDFPHLLKCLWSSLISNKSLETHLGTIHLKFWIAIYDLDKHKHIKMCPRLTFSHIQPTNFELMNVRRAFQFYSHSVASAMQYYKDKGFEAFQDAGSTIEFIEKINNLADIMNSRTPRQALRINSTEQTTVERFLKDLETWKPSPGKKSFSKSTSQGLIITLKSTLSLLTYLSTLNFDFLMTSRLNQDSLEKLFGQIRQAGGASSHPDPVQFAQLFRLVSFYSLAKPPRGSNVKGAEILESLLQSAKTFDEKKHLKGFFT